MSTGTTESKVVWTRSGTIKRDLIVVGRRLSADWTQRSVQTLQVRFAGPLHQALNDLLCAAKKSKGINLPIIRLRASLIASLDGVIALDRDLGALPRPGATPPCALEMYPPIESADSVSQAVHGILKRWCLDVLQPWAATHQFDELARRVTKAASPEQVLLNLSERPLTRKEGGAPRLDMALAAREIGERLAGELLFTEERGPCDLVVNPEAPSNFIELMSPPRLGADGKNHFSMVARVSVVTAPYAAGHFVKVAAAKRVWAKTVPGNKPNAPRKVTGYVLGPGHPFLPVSVLRTKDGWDFGEDFASVRLLADGRLPETLRDAVARPEPDESGWWAGLPELTTLFDSVSPRTVFEADEVDLMAQVARQLKGVAEDLIDFSAHKLRRGQSQSAVKMLNLADVGLAGASLEAGADDADEEAEEADETTEADKLTKHREQNIQALEQVHRSEKPTLWCIGGTPEEQELISKSVQALFGESVALKNEVLPCGAHGLRASLPGAEGTARVRFEERIKAWRPLAESIATHPGPRFALICAPDREGRRSEDVVNYYAGLHAMCALAKANVHHVLPVERANSNEAKQNFVHRLQSALLDVFLAHSGIVFGVNEFLAGQFNGRPPKATYGIQAVRSRARPFSGESDVYFFVVTRLLTESGVTEVQFFYKSGTRNLTRPWLPLAEGLRWLGSQRHLSSGDENWLKASFKDFVRGTLESIGAEDPRALVLIDWENIAGLWQGIRDSDLAPGEPPKLDGANLAAAFPQMSLVRIRKNYDVLSLRSLTRATFEGWREDAAREATGERFIDEYPTTTRSIVELAAAKAAGERRYGHFVVTMGYSKTSQVKRGFSCYRSMSRMTPVKGTAIPGQRRARFFEQTTLTPASTDASVPAPLDVTVMSSPVDVSPADVAVAVMGLRLGYAHYSDWTSLPAPLFFKRKIEDYIIRFSDVAAETVAEPDGEQAVSDTAADEGTSDDSAAVAEAPPSQTAETPLSQAVVESVLPPAPAELSAQMPADTSAAPSRPEPALEQLGDASDDTAFGKQLICLYDSDEPKLKRLYQAMMQDSGALIRVELPSFVTTTEAFGDLSLSNREFQRVWNRTRDFGFVKQTTARPRLDRLTDWMMMRLVKPQAAHSLFAARLGAGPFFFRPIKTIIERYNREAAEPLPIATKTFSDLEAVARWAYEKKDDYAVAWLLFAAAQFPGYGCGERILAGIGEELPGPMSEVAEAYLRSCDEACNEALQHIDKIGRGFPSINKKLSEAMLRPRRKAPAAGQISVAGEPTLTDETAEHESHRPTNVDQELLSAVTGLEPGREDFVECVARARARLAALETVHAERIEEKGRLQRAEEEIARLQERAADLLLQVESQRPDLSLAEILLQRPAAEAVPLIEPQLDAIAGALATVQQWRDEEAALRASPLPPKASLAERRVRAEKESGLYDLIFDSIRKLEEAVLACAAFKVGELPADIQGGAHALDKPAQTISEAQATADALKADAVATALAGPGELTAPHGGAAQPPPLEGSAEADKSAEAESKAVSAEVPDETGARAGVAELATSETAASHVEVPTAPVPDATDLPALERLPTMRQAGSGVATRTETQGDALGEEATTEPEPEEDEAVESISLDEVSRNRHITTLATLLGQRRYALAAIHLRALAQLLPESFAAHRVVLGALFSTLESIDCNFTVDTRLDANLKGLLKNGPQLAPDDCDVFAFSAGIFGASIVSMLFEGPGSENRWDVLGYLQMRFTGHEATSALAEHIGNLDRTGIVLTREAFAASRIGLTSAMAAELKRMSQRAANWSRDPDIHSLWNNHAYRGIHEEMFSPHYPVGHCLTLMAKEDFARLPQAFDEAKKKFDKPAAALEELTRRAKVRVAPDGKPRLWFMQNLSLTGEFVAACVELVHKRSNPGTELVSNVQTYLEGLHEMLQRALAELERFKSSSKLEHVYLGCTATVLRNVLGLFDETHAPVCVPFNQQLLLVQLPMGRDFVPSMAGEVAEQGGTSAGICEPEEVLAETQRLAGEKLDVHSEADDSGLGPALRDAARSHADSHRFLPAFAIAAMYPKTFGAGEASLQALHQKARNALDSELHEVRQRVAHAMALSALEAAEANRMLRVIEDIQTANSAKASIGHLDVGSAAYPDFPHAKAALRRQVLEALDTRLATSRAKLENQIAEYEGAHAFEAARDIERIREMLATKNASSLRAAHDAFAMLLKDGRLPPPVAVGTAAPDAYEAFQRKVRDEVGTHIGLLEGLSTRLTVEAQADDPDWLKALDVAAREDGRRFIQAWTALFATPQTEEKLQAFFAAVGTAGTPVRAQTAAYTLGRVAFYFANRPFGPESGAYFVPPNLGSKGVDVQGYVLAGRATKVAIRQLVQDVGGAPMFVLARANLSLADRAEVGFRAPALIVDDNLVAYLALHPTARVQKLLEVGLLTYCTNPYGDYGGVPVPPEMFFGRQAELNLLRQVQNAAILYGGRRLGKSSLLDQVEREGAIRPGSATVYISLDAARYEQDHVAYAWSTIYKSLCNHNVIQRMPQQPRDWKVVQGWIEKELSDGKAVRSCYLLLDEADALMGRELAAPVGAPSFVRGLQQLCETVQKHCHLRYVIAGLHNTTRMSTEENSPLGKAQAIALEPFNSADDIQRGIELVTKPLAALGFFFEKGSEDLPLRILSVCNFYPAFIQLYCHSLLERMYNVRQEKRPPTYVTAKDLDAVERDGNLLTDLQRKFELNLNLDKRYKAIALILADIFYTESEKGQYQGLTTTQIREYCEAYAAAHFAQTGAGAYEALVDEMRKLSVLERVGSRYVLRNPNIAMMMGDRDRISHQIDELARETPEQARNQGERRIYLKRNAQRQLFPLPAAWVRTNVEANDGELLILVGNNLSGLPDICGLLDEWALGQDCVYTVKNVPTAQAADTALRKNKTAPADASSKRLVAASPNSWRVQAIADYAAVAAKGQKSGRLALIALPDKAYELAMAIDSGTLVPAADGSVAGARIVPVPPWTEDSVHFLLEENVPVSESGEACRALLEASCGFGAEVLRLAAAPTLTVEQAKACVAAAEKTFAPDLQTLYHKVGLPGSVDAGTRKRLQDFLMLLDDGVEKRSEVLREAMQVAGVSEPLVQFLAWMGLLQDGPGNTWRVPRLVRRLLQ